MSIILASGSPRRRELLEMLGLAFEVRPARGGENPPEHAGPEETVLALSEAKAREVMGRLNPNFRRFKEPVKALSGGQRQSVAIARAILFNARILIMDEPTAALGPQETAQVGELIKQLKKEGIGIFLISHDIHDVFDLADRVSVMKNGQVVGHARTEDVTKDEVLGMIILGKVPEKAIPGPGAMQTA